jgi:MazG family protein
LERLDEITRRLRRECPWDREQDERSIVPHTVEEAYELADAAHSGDDAKLLDELGDVLFQVYFLALLLEERGQGSLAEVADHCREKLIRRHPHVFGDRAAETAGDVVRNWNQIKRDDERGGEIFGHIPETLPSTLYAKKVLKRAADAGHDHRPDDVLLAAVKQVVEAGEDPELALRRAADEYRQQVEAE